MLLRNDQQLALNQVETLCIEAADHYATAANKTKDEDLAHLFKDLAAQRGQLISELAVHIRALDDLPQPPDPDKETVGDLITSIKTFFSADERNTLIDEREQFERAVEEAVQDALREALPPETKILLERVLSHVETAKYQLAAART